MVVLISWYNPKKRMIYLREYRHSFIPLLNPLGYRNNYDHVVVGRYMIKNGQFIDIDNQNILKNSSDRKPLFFKKRKKRKEIG